MMIDEQLTIIMVVTFLPFDDIERSLMVLDKRRLGKQRVEAGQILKALNGETKGWVNHPATKMWVGYEFLLKHYYNESLRIWEMRGGKNVLSKPQPLTKEETDRVLSKDFPWWWGSSALHESHKAALIRKDEDYYTPLLQLESPRYLKLGYFWPHKHTSESANPGDDLIYEPINPRQLLPKCAHPGCPNPIKRGDLCGVHSRKR
jgi:hypothetical protein